MRPQEIIARKRDGGELSRAEIDAFIDGVCDESWADYQISALLMAIFLRGMNLAEQDALTYAMLHSGEVLDFSAIDKPKSDKHSTGGVGDKCSLIIAPIVAACGIAVPMISGRGLGHTGGTLDKLESIPGYNVNLSKEEFYRVIDECGFAMAGQTDEIAPADKKLYALRDATATIQCIPLIVASIMSKKLAEGLDSLILDVKTGSGAFMQSFEDSVKLAEALVKTGQNFGVKTEAIISDMSQPLGECVGNAIEVIECIEILSGDVSAENEDTWELSLDLAARMLVLGGIANSLESARAAASEKVANGQALECFRRNVELQGGDASVCDNPELLRGSGLIEVEILAVDIGFVAEIDTFAIGGAIVEIGGGRRKTDDGIDHAVGYSCVTKLGGEIRNGEPLGILFCRDHAQADAVRSKLTSAYIIKPENDQDRPKLIRQVIGS